MSWLRALGAQKGFRLVSYHPNKIRQMVTKTGPDDPCSRVERLLGDKESYPLKNQRVLLCVDGGRLRQRKKRGPRPEGSKRCGFHTDWIESKLFTLYLIAEKGDIKKSVPPFVDGTTGKPKEFLELLRHYLTRLGIKEAC